MMIAFTCFILTEISMGCACFATVRNC